jgi:hypothetical protein
MKEGAIEVGQSPDRHIAPREMTSFCAHFLALTPMCALNLITVDPLTVNGDLNLPRKHRSFPAQFIEKAVNYQCPLRLIHSFRKKAMMNVP